VNNQQAQTIKTILEARAPDAGVTVTPEPGGAEITISGPRMFPDSPKPADIRLSLSDNSPYLMRLLASAARTP
jgi:hypothetical protein